MTEKEKKRLEMYEQRYAESWKKREINEEGTLKPFSKEELEHIFMLNDHLKELTSSTIDKTLRVSIHLLDEIEKVMFRSTGLSAIISTISPSSRWKTSWKSSPKTSRWVLKYHFNKQKKGKNMAAKMSLCTISYNYEHYAGIDVEKLSNIIYEL